MGLLRLFLAVSVIVGHAGPILGATLIPAPVAVVTFFILSGFYMALVINEKYGSLKDGTRVFYSNRLLRLYPIYLAVLVASIALQAALDTQGVFFNSDLDFWRRAAYVLLNFAVVGQDIVSGFDQTFHTFQNHPVSIGWSIATEALFYAIAPFIVRRDARAVVIVLLLGSVVLRVALLGLPADPWRYRLLPSVLVFFLMGVVAYWAWARLDSKEWPRIVGACLLWAGAAAVGIAVAVHGRALPDHRDLDHWHYWIVYLSVACAAPFLFAYTRHSALDNYIGQITYPVYICHNFVTALVVFGFGLQGYSVLIVGLSLLVGVALNLLIERPINRIRNDEWKRASAAPQPAR